MEIIPSSDTGLKGGNRAGSARPRRAHGFAAQHTIFRKWGTVPDPTEINAVITYRLRYSVQLDTCSFVSKADTNELTEGARPDLIAIEDIISPADMLYRLICMGFRVTQPTEPQKIIWMVGLIHLESGEALTFYDYKGDARFGMRFLAPEAMPSSLLSDVLELVTYIVSGAVLHPYDGLPV
jgi:hypothetical protein